MPTKDIEEPLLQNESTGKRKSKKKLCCFILFSTLIVIILLLVISLIVLLIKLSKAETTNNNNGPGNSANLHSDNKTTNKTLCRILTGQNNDSSIIGDGNIYLTKATQNVTEREACIVESVLRQSPDRNVYIIDLNYTKSDSFNSTDKKFDYISYLLKLYKNLHVLTLNKEEFFKYTDFEVSSWNKSTMFAAKLVTAYKFGGVVLSLNFIMMNRNVLKCKNRVLIDEYVLVTTKKCDNFIDYLMKSISICNQNDAEKHTVSSIIKESYNLYCDSTWNNDCKHLKLLHADQFCSHIKENCDFLRLKHFSKLPMKTIQEELPMYCRQVVKIYLQEEMSRKEVEDDLAKVKLEIMKSNPNLPEC